MWQREAEWGVARRPSWVVSAGNAVLGLSPRRRFGVGDLVDAARRQTGLRDLGDEFFMPALRCLIESLHDEADLTPLGSLIQKQRLTNLLANRLRLEQEFGVHADLDQTVLWPAVVIAGLQRSGTTLLHRLLAVHPETRALASWECLNPGPLPRDPGDVRRRRRARRAERAMRFIAPNLFAIHPIEAESPEEDVLLLELSFMSQTSEAILHVPSYARWLEEQDPTPAYRYLVRVLKLIQLRDAASGRARRQWVLKSPNHLEWLDIVLRELERVHIVQTHRHPLETVASFCSMVAHGRSVFARRVNAAAVGRHWLAKIGRLTERALTARERAPTRFVDVAYEDLVVDPAGVVEALHERLGWTRDADVTEALALALARTRKDKYGRHVYRLEDFGLDEAKVRATLGSYMEHRGY
jgi:hypothetical protein